MSSFSKEKSEKFYDAAGGGNLDLVKSLSVDPEVNLNWRHEAQWLQTPFYLACFWDQVGVVRYLLDFRDNHPREPIDFNLTNQFGNTPFNATCLYGRERVAAILLEDDRIDVNQAESEETPFWRASRSGNLGIVKRFLASTRQVDVLKKDREGRAPLDIARQQGKNDVAALIESYQKDPEGVRKQLRRELGYREVTPLAPKPSPSDSVSEKKNEEATSTPAVMNAVGLISLADQASSTPSASTATPFAPALLVEDLLAKVKDNERRLMANERSIGKTADVADEMQKRMRENESAQEAKVQELQEEMKKLGAELAKAMDAATKKDLEERVVQLEASQGVLMKEHEARQQVLREQQFILRNPSFANFYRSLQNKLQQIFLGCKVVASGLAAGDSFTAGEKITQWVQLAGDLIPLPGANIVGMVASAAGMGMSHLHGNKVDRNASLTVSMRELDEVTEQTARRLTFVFEEQLGSISGDSAWLLGECASKEIVAYLWTNRIEDLVVDGNPATLVAQFVATVVKIEREETGQAKVSNMKEKMTGFFGKAKDLADTAWEKINQPIKFNTRIPTITGDQWTADGLFHRSALMVEKEGKRFWFSGGPTRPEKYGYRRGSEEEANEFKLVMTMDRIVSKVKEAAPTSSVSKAMNQQLKNTAAQAQSTEEKMELMAKHIHMLQNQVQMLSASGSPNSTPASPLASAAAKNWSNTEVTSWLEKKGQNKLSTIAGEQDWDGMILFGLYSARDNPEAYERNCHKLGVTSGGLQVKLEGLLVDLFEGAAQ